MGWYSDNSDTDNGWETHAVGLKLPNHFGLHEALVHDSLRPEVR
jgi:hypothetical protein